MPKTNVKEFIMDKNSYVFAPARPWHNGVYAKYVIYLNGQCLVIKPHNDNNPVIQVFQNGETIDHRGYQLTRTMNWTLRMRAMMTRIGEKVMPNVMVAYRVAEQAPETIVEKMPLMHKFTASADIDNANVSVCAGGVYANFAGYVSYGDDKRTLSEPAARLVWRRLQDAYMRHMARQETK